MSPPVPNLQLNQLLIFWHLCFICFSTPHIHSQLQLSSFILLGNFYTLKHTIFHCTIVANEHSHIIYTPTTIQSIFIFPEISFVSPLTRPPFRDKTLIWFFNLWLFLPALELHINETILLWLCLLLFSILFVRLIHFAERFLLDYHCTVSHCENAGSYSGRTIIRWYLTIWTSGDGQWVASVFCLLASLQLCPILCNPMDCSPPGFSGHGVLQARILEWVVIAYCRGSSQPRDQTHISRIFWIGKWVLYH